MRKSHKTGKRRRRGFNCGLRGLRGFLWLRTLALLLALLTAQSALAAAASAQIDFGEVQRRATASFVAADFFKPAERDTEALTFKLAPLLIQEINDSDHAKGDGARFGTLLFTNGLATLETSHPAVYFQPETVLIQGKLHLSLTYLWFYSAKPTRRRGGGLPVQGIRLTLNSGGEPVLWEVLGDPSGAELFFVSHSLEASARAQFGEPLSGRRYAVERGTNEMPKTVVARIVEDGPVPMGPIVYLDARAQAVSTLICRCMPAQAKTLRFTRTYDLLPLPADAPEWARTIRRLKTRRLAAFWPGDGRAAARLPSRLRLPDDF